MHRLSTKFEISSHVRFSVGALIQMNMSTTVAKFRCFGLMRDGAMCQCKSGFLHDGTIYNPFQFLQKRSKY